jgi:cytochrome P450
MYSIFLAHRDPAHWEAPDRFCPARFAHGQENKRPPLTYVPFGGGPRNCIGATFAQIESKVVLARILQHFDLELLNGAEIHPHMGATLEPRPGVTMRIRRR